MTWLTAGRESDVDGIYYLLNATYIQKGTATVLSAFCKDETTLNNAREHFLESFFVKATPGYQIIPGKIHTAYDVTIVSIKPDTAEYRAAQAAGDAKNTSQLHVDEVLDNGMVQLSFICKNFPEDYRGPFIAEQIVSLKQAPEENDYRNRRQTWLSLEWPIKILSEIPTEAAEVGQIATTSTRVGIVNTGLFQTSSSEVVVAGEDFKNVNFGPHTSTSHFEELNEFREVRRMPSTKERCLRLFCAIRTSMALDVCDIISETFKSIDLSGYELSVDDSEAIGFVINRCSHLEIVNLHACKLKPSSLQRLKKEIKGTPKIDKFRVTSNPDLTLDDYKAGIEFCVATEAAFVYNPWRLSVTERKVLKAYAKIYKPQDETIREQLSKQRRRLTREERFQKMYKSGSSSHLETDRVSLKFQSESDQVSGEDPENSSEIRQPSESLTSGTESPRLREQQNEKEFASDNALKSVKQSEENPNAILEEEIKSRSKNSRRRPQTLNELVKMKPLMKFQEMMETYAKEGKLPEFENLGDQARMSRRIANNADRQRFEAATLKKCSPRFQAYARQTRNEVSTVFKKSSKGDSGYKSKSSFSDMVSSKASRRRFSRTSDQGTDISSKIDSTKAASLPKIDEELYLEANQGSCDSGNPGDERREEQFDPRVIAKQRLEMTCLGLGIMQTKKERIEDWLKTAEFNVTPLDLATSDMDENFQKLNIIKDEVRENMGDLLHEVERDMNHGMKSDLEENFKTPTLKINDEVREVMSDLLYEVERANNQETMSDRGNHAETSRRVQLSSAIQESGKSSSESTRAVDDASSVKSNLVSSEGEAIGIQKKSESTDVIGCKGGDIELSDFKISFPENSVTEDKNFRFFVKSTKQKYLKGNIEAIAPILTVQPSIKLNKPALVTVRTWFSAFPGGEASGQLMIKDDDGAWKEDRLVALSDRNVVSFEVDHFSDVTVGKESNVDGIYYLLNETYIQKGTATVASAFYKDETTQNIAGKDFLKLSYVKATPNYQQITGKIHTAHDVTIVCIKPDTAEYVAAQAAGDRENTSRLHVNQVLEDALVQLFFFSKTFPEKYTGSFFTKQIVSLREASENGNYRNRSETLLSLVWPIKNLSEIPSDAEQPSTSYDKQRFDVPNLKAKNVYFGGKGEQIDNRQVRMEAQLEQPAVESSGEETDG